MEKERTHLVFAGPQPQGMYSFGRDIGWMEIEMPGLAGALLARFWPYVELDDSVFCIHLRNAYIVDVSIVKGIKMDLY